jgi:hypothetical protein
VKASHIVAAVAVVAVLAGVVYVARDRAVDVASSEPESAGAAPGAEERAPAPSVAAPAPVAGGPPRRPPPPDPRLAALMTAPNDALIEMIPGPDGRVIVELDKDPASAGFGKPLRQYQYSGDRIVGLTAFRYFSDQTQIIEARVSYKADGSVDKYREETRYEPVR